MTDRQVSSIRGGRQGPALRAVTLVAWLLAGLSALSGADWSHLSGVVALGLVVATPLLRIGWLMHRWRQERDARFIVLATGLVAVIAAGGLLAVVNT